MKSKMPMTFKRPELKKDQQEYLEKIREREGNPDLNILFGPGPKPKKKGPAPPERSIASLRQLAKSVHVACPQWAASEIREQLNWAAKEIERLTRDRDHWKKTAFKAMPSAD